MSVHIPVRSISLPSRLLHPNSLKIQEELTKIQSLKSLSFSSSETIQIGLTRLAELFVCIQELISHSPQTHPQNSDHVEDVLDRSVGLIDICCSVRDMFLTMQEYVRDLQSALRRRSKDSSIENNVQAYINFRKKAKKVMTKSLRTLKRYVSYEEEHSSDAINVVREAHEIAANIFQSLLLFLSSSEMKMNSNSRWLILSKFIRSGFLTSDKDHHKIFNEVESVDIALCSIHGKIKKSDNTKFDVQEVQERLKALSATIQQLEAKLDCVFRCLIQNRVSLLNLVTP